MLKRILAFHAKRCRFARKQQRRNLRFKSKVLDHFLSRFHPIFARGSCVLLVVSVYELLHHFTLVKVGDKVGDDGGTK